MLIANAPAILHLVTANPLYIDADLTPPLHGTLPGQPYIDPNTGFTMQALGHRAALDWIHGHIPWWNPYEGVGAPLAGEMQGGAFFPPTLLLLFHDGVLALQLLMETVTGWSTYALLRRMGVGRTIATGSGVAFGLCGTFAWITHAPMRPIAFLPLALLGVELAIGAASARRRGGWVLLALAIAFSILAGFPETTLIDGVLVVWWAILRSSEVDRALWLGILGRIAMGGVVGVALAAPLIAAFAGYLPSAEIGGHSGGFAFGAIPPTGIVQTILPYSLGPIFAFQSPGGSGDVLGVIWGNVGGFLTVTLIAAALVGIVGRRYRTLRIGLAAWIAVALLRTYGWPPVLHLLSVVPGLKSVAVYRYANPSWEMAVVILAALGLDDVARSLTRRRMLAGGVVLTALLATWAAATAWPLMRRAVTSPPSHSSHPTYYVVGSLALAGVSLALLLIGGLLAGHALPPVAGRASHRERSERTRRRGRLLMAGIVSVEAVTLLGFTYLSAPRSAPLQLGSVTWLQQHLGTQRFYTLGPIQPDYGSFYGIAQANVNDLPLPKTWSDYTGTSLDPNTPEGLFTGTVRSDPSKATPAQELDAHLAAFESVGVGYVVEGANGLDIQGQPFPTAGSPPWPAGPRLVYRDSFAEIWQLPGAAPVFSTTGSCTVSATGWDQARVDCSRPGTLVRRVQAMPGWTATVGGAPGTVRTYRQGPPGLFQAVDVPAGTSTVTFSYLPPHARLAILASALATLWILAYLVLPMVRRRRRSSGTRDELSHDYNHP